MQKLTMAITEWDRKQQSKKFYNKYALGIMLKAASNVESYVSAGYELRRAILGNFNGRLCDFILKQMELPLMTREELRGTYLPDL